MREKNIITKENLIRNIASKNNKTITDTRDFYNTLEKIIFDTLSSVDENQDVCIRLFEGVNLDGKYELEKTKKNNLTGQINVVPSKIKPKFNITRTYCEKLNNK